ncbi:MAG: hypothetical protein R2821_02285 [Flavobacteriaceae bacterium]
MFPHPASSRSLPNITVYIEDGSGNNLATFNTGNVTKDEGGTIISLHSTQVLIHRFD